MQTAFKSGQEYKEWRNYWRRHYKMTSFNIRFYKNRIRETDQEHERNLCRALLRREQMIARDFMIARESVDHDYQVALLVQQILSGESIEIDAKPELVACDDQAAA